MLYFLRTPVHLEIERRFLLASPPPLATPALVHARPSKIVQTRLNPFPGFGRSSRVRATQLPDGKTVYHWTAKRKLSSRTKEERESRISKGTYEWLLAHASEDAPQVKTRWVFDFEGLRYELDHVYDSPLRPEHWLLEVELKDEQQEFRLPPFLDIKEELTPVLADA